MEAQKEHTKTQGQMLESLEKTQARIGILEPCLEKMEEHIGILKLCLEKTEAHIGILEGTAVEVARAQERSGGTPQEGSNNHQALKVSCR